MKHCAAFLLMALGVSAQDKQEAPAVPIAIEEVKLDRPADFKVDIHPIFKTKCLACHNAKDAEGGVVLESPKAIIQGGDEGPAVVPGKSDQSLLLQVASHRKKPVMPPKKNKIGAEPLTPRELGLIKLWIDQGAKGNALPQLDPPKWQPPPASWNPIYSTALDPDGQIAACGRAGRLYLYHVPTQRLLDQPSDPKLDPFAKGLADRDAVLSIAFSPRGDLLATGGYRTIRLWKKSLAETKSTAKLPADIKIAALSPDATRLAVAGADHAVKLINLADGKILAEMKGHTDAVHAIRFSANGAALLSGSADKTARFWKLPEGTALGKIDTGAAVTALEWTPDDTHAWTGGGDGAIRLFAAPAGAAPLKEIKDKAAIADLRLVEGALYSAIADGRLVQWNVENGQKVREVAHGAPMTAFAVSAAAKRILTVGGPTAILWETEKGTKVAELKTEGSARRTDAAAASLLAFAGNEVKYREGVVKGFEDAKKKEEDEVKKAADALPAAEKALKEREDAAAKAKTDRETAEKAIAHASRAVEAGKSRLELAVNALAITDPELAIKQAELDTQGVLDALQSGDDARARAEAAQRMLALGRAGLALAKAQPHKAGLDQALANHAAATSQAKAALDAASKAAADAKSKADALAKAAEEAKKKAAAAPEAEKKPAEEAAAKAEADRAAAAKAHEKAEADRKPLEAAHAEESRKHEEAKLRVAAADKALQQAKADHDKARQALEAARAAADAAIKAAEAQVKEGTPKIDAAKKAEVTAAQAVETAKLAFESAKGRVDKAKEAVARHDKSIANANAALEAQKKSQANLDGERKAAAEALTKAKINFRSGVFVGDGSLVALAAEDGRLYTFGAEKGIESASFDAHAKPALALAAAGGETISVGSDGSVRKGALLPSWKLHQTIEPAEPAKPPDDRVLALAFSPDGKILASGGGVPSRDGEILLWNVADGKLIREIAGAHSDTVFDLAFTPDGSLLASAAADKFARVFDMKSYKLIKSFEGHTNHVLGVSWNRTGRTLATAGADDQVKVWNLETGQQTKSIPGFSKQATALRYMPFEGSFVVAGGGVPVRLVVEAGNVTKNYDSGGAFMYDVAMSGDGQLIAAGGLDGTFRLWRSDGAVLVTFPPPGVAPTAK